MKLWRLEAMHAEGDGAFVRYYLHEQTAVYEAAALEAYGWFSDVEAHECGDREQLVRLAEGIWPAEDHETILGLLPVNPVAAAAARLQEILSKQRRDDE